jgi:hypothetical protein
VQLGCNCVCVSWRRLFGKPPQFADEDGFNDWGEGCFGTVLHVATLPPLHACRLGCKTGLCMIREIAIGCSSYALAGLGVQTHHLLVCHDVFENTSSSSKFQRRSASGLQEWVCHAALQHTQDVFAVHAARRWPGGVSSALRPHSLLWAAQPGTTSRHWAETRGVD